MILLISNYEYEGEIMSTCAIIAEYNPFHNGHLHQINTIKKELHCDNLIVIMSGNFTQRGIPAICDKAARTKIAIECGASIVIELPVIFATSSAEFFAKGAIKILDRLNCIDYLVYGIENYDDNSIIKEAANIVISQNDTYNYYVKKFKRNGLSYPASCESAFLMLDASQKPNKKAAFEHLFMPNNVLALEYEKALLELNSTIKTYSVKRKGNSYSSEELDNSFASATAIRNGLLNHKLDLNNLEYFMPACSVNVFDEIFKKQLTIYADDFSEMVLIKLLELGTHNPGIYDLSDDILNKIKNNLNKFKSLTTFVSEIKTKDYTYNRLMRVFCHILLNIKSTDLMDAFSNDSYLYARILGFNTDSQPLLNKLKTNSSIPLITNVKDAEKKLSKDALWLFNKDIFASNLYNSVCRMKTDSEIKNEYQYRIIKTAPKEQTESN